MSPPRYALDKATRNSFGHLAAAALPVIDLALAEPSQLAI